MCENIRITDKIATLVAFRLLCKFSVFICDNQIISIIFEKYFT